jgi:hypothetical protein
MDALTSTAPATAPAPASAPAPAPAPAPAMPLTAAPMTAAPSTGFSGQGFKDFMKSINWVEIGFGVLGTAVLYYTIFDDLTMKVSDLSSVVNSKESTQKQQSPNDLFV